MFVLGVTSSSKFVLAEEQGSGEMKSLAKASQNPVADLISLPFENNLTFNNGSEDALAYILNIKPVIPTKFTENWNLINRMIIPAIYQGERFPEEGDIFGLGDIMYQGFISPANAGKLVWGIGPQLQIPTGMDRLSTNQWALGPSVIALTMPGNWVMGLLASNMWNIGGGYNDPPKVNFFSTQYFINYNMKGGWYLSTSPTITANWEADDDNTWTVPFGGGIGRVFKMGKRPVNMKLVGYYNVEKPEYASDWSIQMQMTFLYPK
jgi:hypothetical protein